jgi:hypothetical protein
LSSENIINDEAYLKNIKEEQKNMLVEDFKEVFFRNFVRMLDTQRDENLKNYLLKFAVNKKMISD